ncbi:MAG: flagellar biosynthesis anti-sigma factor FlgM [Lachnospiraceae bacterium]|nr:flagellar biosynthesis anti-sigma factor FlgM [Lachnospiraceae bacterium]MCI7595198.1 flagellar biosynthesis anti-sigma factor FlgM [Lachnospiraceae bacterium]MDD7049886.1 flagellar biosynthesis anti-sigma factor FlgM [Lachnospiraceae bacterium]MDY3222616.1 flagellar biosynthesis anti-sigma factor FlgM [Lachnospiraceae bacterium]MDY4096449.1 flagellar biosynthesis anti-sigma factor FlgM [Lachnospiraceae bacterium]
MRIDAYQQVQQVYSTKQTHKALKEERRSLQDRLQISSTGKDIQVAKQALENTSDVRSEVVDPLKSKIEAGTYKVGVDAFAARLFEKYNELHLGSF